MGAPAAALRDAGTGDAGCEFDGDGKAPSAMQRLAKAAVEKLKRDLSNNGGVWPTGKSLWYSLPSEPFTMGTFNGKKVLDAAMEKVYAIVFRFA